MSIAPSQGKGTIIVHDRGITRRTRVKNRWKYIFADMSTEEIHAYVETQHAILANHVEKKNFLRAIPVKDRIPSQQARLNALHGEIGRINSAFEWLKKHKEKAYQSAIAAVVRQQVK